MPLRRTTLPIQTDSAAVREAQAHLAQFPVEHRGEWLRKLDELFTAFAAEKRYSRRILKWSPAVVTSQWLPISGRIFRPISDADVLHDPDFQTIPAFESLLVEISEERALSMLVAVSLLIDRDATWHDARSVNIGAAHLAGYRPILAEQQHQAYRKRVQKRRAASKGGKARAATYAVPKEWVISKAKRLSQDRSRGHKEKMDYLFLHLPCTANGDKPSRSIVYRWLKKAKIRL
jgi:hypothetical protein